MQALNSTIQMRHLASFVVTAEELHFTRAAARLHIAQQTLSQQIRQLETSLGVPLFERSTRKVQLTEAGIAFHKRCVELVAAFEAAVTETERVHSGETGSVRIAFTPSYADLASTLRAEIGRLHPSVRVALVECWSEQALSGTLNGTYQATLVHSELATDGLASRPAAATEVGVVLGAGDPLAQADVVPRAELLARTLTLWPEELSPTMFGSMTSMFTDHFARGDVYQFETFARGLFLDDQGAVDLILSAQGFTPAVKHQVRLTDPQFVWRPIDPPGAMPARLAFRADADTSGVRLVLESAEHLWGAA